MSTAIPNSLSQRAITLAFLMLGFPLPAVALDAQNASDRPSARPPATPEFLHPQPAGGFSLPPVPAPAASGTTDEAGRFAIRGYAFEGNTAFSQQELARLAAPFVGNEVGIGDLEELRQLLTRHYIDHGYVNSGAVVPDDPLRDGLFRYRIVEGRLDEVRVKGQGRLRAGYVQSRLLRGAGTPLAIQSLQDHFQWLLTDPLIDRMNARLLPGAAPGSGILEVEVSRARPYQFSLVGNNYRPPSIGAEAVGANGWVRNLTGLGDYLNLSFAISEGATRYSGYWEVPLGDYGTQAYFQFDEGNSSVIEEPLNRVDIDSKIHNLEGGLRQTLLDSLQRKLTLGASFAVRENETRLLGEAFSFVRGLDSGRNQATVLRFEQDFVQRWETQALSLRSTFSLGLNALGATPERDPRNPDSEFFAWLGQAQYAWRVMENGAQVVFRGDVQVSDDPLLPLEQIAVGGVGSVRGYRENQLVRDQGYGGSLEFHYPLLGDAASAGHHSLVLIPFMDYGEAWNHGERSDYLHSVGIGFHWNFYNLDTALYWAHPIKAAAANKIHNLQDDGIHFQVRLDAFH